MYVAPTYEDLAITEDFKEKELPSTEVNDFLHHQDFLYASNQAEGLETEEYSGVMERELKAENESYSLLDDSGIREMIAPKTGRSCAWLVEKQQPQFEITKVKFGQLGEIDEHSQIHQHKQTVNSRAVSDAEDFRCGNESYACLADLLKPQRLFFAARVYNQKNLKGSHEDVHGYGCGNVGSSKFKVNSIHLRHSTFCYLYEKKNCKGSSIYVARDVNDLHLDTIYLFENVRFGAKPVRFGPSDFPSKKTKTPFWTTDCLQINPSVLKNPPGGRHRLGDPFQDLDPDMPHPSTANWTGTEDCLFLDVYVPRRVFEDPGAQLLPVTVWFYGGAYAFGTKRMKVGLANGPLYNGRSLIRASNYSTIVVAGNYRLGAFGWLAGSFMEKNGLPNAGLYDQNLLLRWVQKYIGQVHGDNKTVSAWGESAGGGSILHHLIRGNGNEDPLLTRFLTQSPAFEWAWDNSTGGQLDQVYQNFSESLGCYAPYDINCIRNPSFSLETLGLANVNLFRNVKQTGLFPVGPAVDNAWITTIPTLAFAQKKFWPGIKSALVSHCANDAQSFTPNITTNESFYGFLAKFLPGEKLAELRTEIAEQYDCVKNYGGNYKKCLRHIIRDASFTCNTRDLIDAYPQQAYAMNYGFPNDSHAFHATDLIPLFGNVNFPRQIATMFEKGFDYSKDEAKKLASSLNTTVIKPYLQYLSSFAVYGNTNANGTGDTGWPVVDRSGPLFSNVMRPNASTWSLVTDDQNSKDTCDFWRQKIAAAIMPPNEQIVDANWDTDVQEEL
ncbi:carboxylesterase family [Fusarium sp. NRRL 52700]|nr:carboxylesterase family [Fusarium sp. NRRL 52700]